MIFIGLDVVSLDNDDTVWLSDDIMINALQV